MRTVCIRVYWNRDVVSDMWQVQEQLEPEHLKMKDQRSGKSTNQWILLLVLAKTEESLSWQHRDADNMLKKRSNL